MAFGDKKPQVSSAASVSKTVEINVEMHGSLTFKDPVDLKINGVFSGSLDVRGTLTVGAQAQVDADISGDNIILSGRVKGNVRVSKLLTLMPTAVLNGDIYAPKLNIVEGAVFQGACHMAPVENSDSMSLKDLAIYLELEESVILELVKTGKIPVTRDGDILGFDRREIDNWAVSGIVK